MAFTDRDSTRAYLGSEGVGVVSIKPLSGGVASFFFRVTTFDHRALFVKSAEPYNNIQGFIGEFEERKSYVTVPCVESYDAELHVLVMSAEGLRDLKDAYTDLKIDTKAVGRGLGIWSERFHERVRAMEMSRDPVNDPAVNAMCKTSYNGLEKVAEKYGFDVEVLKEVNVGVGSRLSDRHQGCCHGDFWPGASKEEFDMAFLDWAMIRMGSNMTDVGQFAAEVILLNKTRG